MCCCTFGKGWSNSCEACPVKGTKAYRRLCERHDQSGGGGGGGGGSGGGGDGFPEQTKQHDMCAEMSMVCQNGKCVNLPDNKIRCICDPGYR